MKLFRALLLPLSQCCAGLLMTLAGGTDAWAQSAEPPKENLKPMTATVAKVNGTLISAEDLKEAMDTKEQMLRYQFQNDAVKLENGLAGLKHQVLDSLIDCQLLVDEFYKIGGVMKPEYLEADYNQVLKDSFQGSRDALMTELAKSGLTEERFRRHRERMIIMNVMRARFAGNVEPTDDMVRDHYEKNNQRWIKPERVKFHTVTISKETANAQSLAERVHTKLVNGEDFAMTARASSTDSHAAAGGEWKWMNLSALTTGVSQALTKMKPGDLSKALELQDSFLVLRLDGRKVPEPKPFESVKKEVKQSLIEEICNERIEKRMIQLRDRANIQKMGSL